eukprot:TRINITY_DN108362_c0_g1_i1.p1 TRINITY_DN108362_c0_g1~~TRINITY_DN108362_c0_g1_i1.p1  ORF type:complete len:450 (+),score=84.68 TRINITY_DN108362_c0_g1_i1:158-1351(+)
MSPQSPSWRYHAREAAKAAETVVPEIADAQSTPPFSINLPSFEGHGGEATPEPFNRSLGLEAQEETCKRSDIAELRDRINSRSMHVTSVQSGRTLCTTHKSSVFLGKLHGSNVVMKVLKQDMEGSREEVDEILAISKKEMLHEIDILLDLRHPNIVTLVGANLDRDDHPFFVLEHMQGGDVETYMHQQRMKSYDGKFKPPHTVAMEWSTSVAKALAYLHGRNCPIIHRDLKPLNLLLTDKLALKVTDFGISKVMPSRDWMVRGGIKPPAPMMSGGVGTWRYMAPEVVRYEQYTDRVDVYSWSLIVYLIFSGKQPFYSFCRGDSELILKAYLKGHEVRPELNPKIGTPELQHLMQDAWHPVASERPSAQQCVERLESLPTKKNSVFTTNLPWRRGQTS